MANFARPENALIQSLVRRPRALERGSISNCERRPRETEFDGQFIGSIGPSPGPFAIAQFKSWRMRT